MAVALVKFNLRKAYLISPVTAANPANRPMAKLTGSGTAVMSRLQPFNVVVSPGTESAKNSFHVSFVFSPLNAV